MKQILLPVLIISLLASCKSDKKHSEKDSLISITPVDESKAVIAEFKNIINGQWIKSDYLSEIAKSKSPLKAWSKAFDITELFINADSIRGDSLNFQVNYTYHEGGDFILKFRRGHSPNVIAAYQAGGNNSSIAFELGYSITNRDTSLVLYSYGQNKKLISTDKFSRLKANNETTKNGTTEASYYWINQLTVAGNYEMTDTSGTRSNVVLKSNGEVNGLGQFKNYLLAIDFTTPPNNTDQIYFDISDNRSKPFIYKLEMDTLFLYNTRYDKDSVQLVIEKLKYKLVKHKPY